MFENFDELLAFAQVAETGSFKGASTKLGRDASVISRRVTQLEKNLGVRLLVRTTRSVTLTEAGVYYLRRVRSALDELTIANREVGDFAKTPQGVLKISLPMTFGRIVIAPLLSDFLKAYPKITVEAQFIDRMVDVVTEGFDAVIRVGTIRDSSLVGRQLGVFRSQLVAAPAYLQTHGMPETPAELEAHTCLCFTAHPDWPNWILEKGKKKVSLRPKGPLVVNTSESLLPTVLMGTGIALLPGWMATPYLREGRLQRVLPDWQSAACISVSILMPPGALVPAKTRVFIETVSSALQAPAAWG